MKSSITDNLGLGSARVINLIGGGGKTSLMFNLARELTSRGERVITTTTTKIKKPDPREFPVVLFGTDPIKARQHLRQQLLKTKHVTVAFAELPGHKLTGIGPEVVDELGQDPLADRIVVEADGSAGLSLKAHQDHEPVISPCADLVVVVIGIDCIGAPLDPRFVHRAEVFSQRLNRPMGSTITVNDVAAIVFHRDGYLAKVPAKARVVILLNKVDHTTEPTAACCAEALYRADPGHRLDRIVLGSLKEPRPWLKIVAR